MSVGRLALAPVRPLIRARRLGKHGDVVFVLPLLVLLGFFILYPAVTALYHAGTDWMPGYPSPYVGLKNFHILTSSTTFQQILRNEGFFLLGVPLWTLIPLVVSLLLYERVPFAGLFRTLFFFPAVLSPAIVGILFRAILRPDGLLNSFLHAIGLSMLEHQWVDDPSLVKPTLIVVLAWAGMGLGVVLFSAALSAIPAELFEAAELDGASWWGRLRYVMLPQIRNVVVMYMILQVVNVFVGLFPWVYVLTQGGPGYSSSTMDYDIYTRSLSYGDYGVAAAEAVCLLAIVVALLAVVWAGRRVSKRLRERDVTWDPAWRPARFRLGASGMRRFAGDGRITRAALQAMKVVRRLGARRRWSVGRTAFLVILAVPFVYPFVFMLMTALKTTADYNRNPVGLIQSFTMDHFRYAWNVAQLGRGMVNSAVAVGVGVVVCTLISGAAAFWFRRRFASRLGKSVFAVVVFLVIVPQVIYVIPFFLLMNQFHLVNSLVVLGVAYAAAYAPLGVWILWSYLGEGLPTEVLEAAEIDGASLLRQFRHVVLPLSRPALGTVVAITFVFMWGDLLLAVVLLQDPSKFTAVLGAAALVTRANVHNQEVGAAAVLVTIPMLAVFLFAQRAIVRGLTAGIGK